MALLEGGFRARLLWVLLLLGGVFLAVSERAWKGFHGADSTVTGTILFSSVGRQHFAFDLYKVAVPNSLLEKGTLQVPYQDFQETKLTDGVSINYNGKTVEGAGKVLVLDRLRQEGINVADDSTLLMFVSERDGSSRIYLNLFGNETQNSRRFQMGVPRHQGIEVQSRETKVVMTEFSESGGSITVDAFLPADGPLFFDSPSVAGGNIVYVSTSEAPLGPGRQNWAAVYSTNLQTGTTVRLTPIGVADFSPSVSPLGEWVAVASTQHTGFQGEVEELPGDLYVYKSLDGSQRRLVTRHGGWPSWANDHTIFFHRKADDGWWSVFRIFLPEPFLSSGEGAVEEERVTPPGVHAFTPAASTTGEWVAVATHRPGSPFRHVEIFDLTSQSFVKLTENVSPRYNHYNPFVSHSSGFVGYHRCRGISGRGLVIPVLQEVRSPIPNLAIIRVDGTFPSASPDGSLIAFTRSVQDQTYELSIEETGIYVGNINGTGLRKVFTGQAFSTAWDWKRKGVLYSSYGDAFKGVTHTVHVISLHNVDGEGEVSWKQLTKTGNNAFPSPSPDGRYLVFRSGRSGFKNLYIMDAVDGEEKEIWQLTDGPWTDQHPAWSPSGEWIAFTSNRDNPGSDAFSVYLIHPDGTGLHKVFESSQGGMAAHPVFSPDSQKLVVAADLAGLSSEPISLPHQWRPFGELFIANVDGSNVQRLTHNALEDATPVWTASFLSSADLSVEGQVMKECNFFDPTWLTSGVQMDSSTTMLCS